MALSCSPSARFACLTTSSVAKLWKSDTAFVCRNDQRKLAFSIKSFGGYSIPNMQDPYRFKCPVREYHTPRVGHGESFLPGQLFQRRIRKASDLFDSAKAQDFNCNIHGRSCHNSSCRRQYHLFAYSTDDEKRNYLLSNQLSNQLPRVSRRLWMSYFFRMRLVTGYFARDRSTLLALRIYPSRRLRRYH